MSSIAAGMRRSRVATTDKSVQANFQKWLDNSRLPDLADSSSIQFGPAVGVRFDSV